MSRTITEIAEAFSRHEFEETYQHMLEDIDWQLVGEKHIRGRGSVVAACEETRKSLISVRTTFSKFRVITAERSVVIDSRAGYVDAEGEFSHVASCDIFDFHDGTLAAITSYNLEVDEAAND